MAVNIVTFAGGGAEGEQKFISASWLATHWETVGVTEGVNDAVRVVPLMTACVTVGVVGRDTLLAEQGPVKGKARVIVEVGSQVGAGHSQRAE